MSTQKSYSYIARNLMKRLLAQPRLRALERQLCLMNGALYLCSYDGEL